MIEKAGDQKEYTYLEYEIRLRYDGKDDGWQVWVFAPDGKREVWTGCSYPLLGAARKAARIAVSEDIDGIHWRRKPMTDDLYVKCPACGGTGKQRGRGGSVGLGACGVCDGERYVPVGVTRGEVVMRLKTVDWGYTDVDGLVGFMPVGVVERARELLTKLGEADD